MVRKGRRWLCLVLACVLWLAGSPQALAETVPPEGAELIYESADLSGMIYQAGGFGTPAREDDGIAAYAITPSDRLKDEILQALRAGDASLKVNDYEMTSDAIFTLFSEVLNENGELFYVKSGLRYSEQSTTGIVDTLYFSYDVVTDREKRAFASKLEEASALVADITSDMEKALVLHDYLTQHCAYAYQEYIDGTLENCSNVYDAYGALVRGRAVCQGYAEAYQAMLKKVGIASYVCASDSMNHAWNVVLIDGCWYHVDATWDDPTWNREGQATHDYFLLSDAEMINRKHRDWNDKVECNSTKYDAGDYWWRKAESQIVRIASHDYIYVSRADSVGSNLIRRTGETEVILYHNELPWSVWDGSGWWSGTYMRLSRQGDQIYFNDRTKLYSLSLSNLNTDPKTEYTYDKDDGYIYGAMVYENKKVRLNIAQRPNAETDSYIEVDLRMILPVSTPTPAPTATPTPAPTATPTPTPIPGRTVSGMLQCPDNTSLPEKIELICEGREPITAEFSVSGGEITYYLSNVPAGAYTLRMVWQGHVTREYPLTVGDEDVSVPDDVKPQLLGDVNGDGVINARDKKLLYNHIEKIAELSDYQFRVADANGDGVINARDKKKLYNHIEKISLLW